MGKRFYLVLILVLVPLLVLTACDGGGTTTTTSTTSASTTTTTTSTTTTTTSTTQTQTETQTQTQVVYMLESTSFGQGLEIPFEYSFAGGNKSPQLSWIGVPEGTISFVLIMDDLEVHNPEETDFFCHWIVFNIPADVFELAENQPVAGTLANGAIQGRNSFGMISYAGPDPPPGETHHYRFRLYALDTTLDLAVGAERHEVIEAIEGHILDYADYIGYYIGI